MIPLRLSDIFGDAKVVPVWDPDPKHPEKLQVFNRFDFPLSVRERMGVEYVQMDGTKYVIVHFNAPGNPPSNSIGYLYLDPSN